MKKTAMDFLQNKELNKKDEYVYKRKMPSEIKNKFYNKSHIINHCGTNKKDFEKYHRQVEDAILLAMTEPNNDSEAFTIKSLIFKKLEVDETEMKKYGLIDNGNVKVSENKFGLTTNDFERDFDRWLEEYKRYLKSSNNTRGATKQKSIEQYESRINQFKNWIIENKPKIQIQNINKNYLLEFIDYKKMITPSFGSNTEKQYVVTIGLFFSWISENNEEGVVLMSKDKKERINVTVEKREIVSLDSIEQEKFYDHLSISLAETTRQKRTEYRNKLVVKILAKCGLRAVEITGIPYTKKEKIEVMEKEEIKRKEIEKQNKKRKREGKQLIKYEPVDEYYSHLPLKMSSIKEFDDNFYSVQVIGKRNKQRTVHIKKEYIQEEFEFLKKLGFEYVAETKPGRAMDRKALWNEIKKVFENAGIDKTGVHILRHTFARNLVGQNINISTIQDLMGHENISTTMIYAKTNSKSKVDAAALL